MSRRDPWTWLGLAVVGLAAAVMSFDALADLARLVHITGVIELGPVRFQTAWLLPITIDVLAAVTTRVWLRRISSTEALVFARWSAWSAIGASIAGNAYHGYLTGQGRLDVVLVAAVPAVAVGTMVHLAVLVGRGPDPAPIDRPLVDVWSTVLDDLVAEAWDRPVGAWLTAVEDADRRIPSRDESDDVLVADLRQHLSRTGRPISRAGVMARYRIGADRATSIRTSAELDAAPTAMQVA